MTPATNAIPAPPAPSHPVPSSPLNGHDPGLAAVLARIDERLARVERALEMATLAAGAAPAAIATAVDTMDDLARMAQERGIDIDARLRMLARVMERLTAPEALSAVETLLDKVDSLKAVLASGVLDPSALAAVATAGDALAKAASAPPAPMGMWAAFRASGDPEVQAALGFLVRFAHAFGADLRDPPGARKLLTTTEIR
jgi:uncharacterized protein YjgD (DUF1641 family)